MAENSLDINQRFHDVALQLDILKLRVERVESELNIKKKAVAQAPVRTELPENPAINLPPNPVINPVVHSAEKPLEQLVEEPKELSMPAPVAEKSTFDEPLNEPVISTQPRTDRAEKKPRDWESIIGGKWALWVGSLSIFLAIASFIAYSWDKFPPAPPWLRVLAGIVAGFAMIGVALYSRSRLQKWFSEGLAGGGLAVIYLSLWAASQSFGLFSFNIAFILMGLTTAFGVIVALRFDAISLSILAMLGGFLTPLLLQSSSSVSNSGTALFLYLAVLNTGIVAISIYKRWNALSVLNLVATYILLMGYFASGYSITSTKIIFGYLTYYFLLFVAASCFYSLVHREKSSSENLLLLIAAASLHGIFAQCIIADKLGSYPGAFCAAMAVFFAGMAWMTHRLAADNKTLLQSTFGLSTLFFTIAIPLQLHQEVLVMAWCIEAGLLLVLGLRFQSVLLQRFGQVLWCMAMLLLMPTFISWAAPPQFAFFNEWAITALIAIVATAIVVVQQRLIINRSAIKEPFYDRLTPVYTCAVIFGGAALICNELYLLNSWDLFPTNQTWQAATGYFICMAIAMFSVLIFSAGVALRDALMRMSAMVLLAITAICPFYINAAYSAAGWHVLLNPRWLTFVIVAVAMSVFGVISKGCSQHLVDDERSLLRWCPVGIGSLLLLGMSVELFRALAPQSSADYMRAVAAISLLWIAYGTALQVIALMWRAVDLRILGLSVALFSGGCFIFTSGLMMPDESGPLASVRSLVWAVGVVALLVMAVCEKQLSATKLALRWHWSVYILLAGATLIWGMSQEVFLLVKQVVGVSSGDWNYLAGYCLVMLWLCGAAIFVYWGVRQLWLHFRNAGYALVALAVCKLCYNSIDSLGVGWMPFMNLRFMAFVAAVVTLGGGAYWLNGRRERILDSEGDFVSIAAWGSGILVLWCLTQEAFEACSFYQVPLGENWVLWAQMAISLVWSVSGAVLLMLGINRKYQPLRYVALGILSVTVFKVFLFDLGFLDGVLRILSLGGLGLALIFISWLYSRYVKVDQDKTIEAGGEG